MRRFTVFLLLTPAVALTLTQTISAQSRPRPPTRLVGRVFDQTRRLVPGVQVFVNRGEVRAATDTDGIFQLDVLPSDSTIGFRRIGYRPLVVRVDPLPPVGDNNSRPTRGRCSTGMAAQSSRSGRGGTSNKPAAPSTQPPLLRRRHAHHGRRLSAGPAVALQPRQESRTVVHGPGTYVASRDWLKSAHAGGSP